MTELGDEQSSLDQTWQQSQALVEGLEALSQTMQPVLDQAQAAPQDMDASVRAGGLEGVGSMLARISMDSRELTDAVERTVANLPLPSEEGPVTGTALYARILPPSLLPEVSPVDSAEQVVGRIVTDHDLTVGALQIPLKRHRLAAFNSTMQLRDREPTTAEALELGFGTGLYAEKNRRQLFQQSFESVANQLRRAAGTDVFTKITMGSPYPARYGVNPNFTLVDERES